jgi:hypothetical protein
MAAARGEAVALSEDEDCLRAPQRLGKRKVVPQLPQLSAIVLFGKYGKGTAECRATVGAGDRQPIESCSCEETADRVAGSARGCELQLRSQDSGSNRTSVFDVATASSLLGRYLFKTKSYMERSLDLSLSRESFFVFP